MEEGNDFYREKAIGIFSESNYMTIGTSTKEGRPWTAPVLYVHDDNYRIYFLSAVDSVHAENILSNPEVSITIFDSKQEIGTSDGIQAVGHAEEVGEDEIEKVIRLYCGKIFPGSGVEATKRYVLTDYLGGSEFRFFRINLEEIYVTGEERRVRVNLGK